jgi:ATP-dependent Zn protease
MTTIDIDEVAAMTSGMVGADLANLVNEAALLAVRRSKSSVGLSEIKEAVERVVAGLEKKNRLITAEEKGNCRLPRTGARHCGNGPRAYRPGPQDLYRSAWHRRARATPCRHPPRSAF